MTHALKTKTTTTTYVAIQKHSPNPRKQLVIALIERLSIALPVKGKDQFWKRPLSKNGMEALITNHVEDYVLTNTL